MKKALLDLFADENMEKVSTYHLSRTNNDHLCGDDKIGPAILLYDHLDGCTHVDLWRKLCPACELALCSSGPYR